LFKKRELIKVVVVGTRPGKILARVDDWMAKDQSFGIVVIDYVLSPFILTCLPYLEDGRRRKDLFSKKVAML